MAAENINGLISKAGCFCLNEKAASHPFSNLFAPDHSAFLESDADEQLLITISFNQTVSLKNLVFHLPTDETCPQSVKLYLNQPSLGFSDANDMPATQALTLSPSDSVEQPVQQNLSAAKWQRVDSITIFVENNHGAETTVIHGLKIFGVPIHGTNVSEIHK
eukprot:gene9319-11963_t